MYLAWKRYSGNGYYNYSLKQKDISPSTDPQAGGGPARSPPHSAAGCSSLALPPTCTLKRMASPPSPPGCLPCSSLTSENSLLLLSLFLFSFPPFFKLFFQLYLLYLFIFNCQLYHFLYLFIFNRLMIALQYWFVFCHIST